MLKKGRKQVFNEEKRSSVESEGTDSYIFAFQA